MKATKMSEDKPETVGELIEKFKSIKILESDGEKFALLRPQMNFVEIPETMLQGAIREFELRCMLRDEISDLEKVAVRLLVSSVR